jgi:hypothetical protein
MDILYNDFARGKEGKPLRRSIIPSIEQSPPRFGGEMKKLAFVSWLVLLAVLTASCQFPGTKIKPGDKIGGMEFISEYEKCPAPNFNDICGGFESLVNGTCEIPADMTQFWISLSLVQDTQEALELAWKDSEWSMTFDGYEVDLYAFGTFDMDLEGQRARAWNVCISNPTPGRHTVIYKWFIKNAVEWGNFTTTHSFKVLGE